MALGGINTWERAALRQLIARTGEVALEVTRDGGILYNNQGVVGADIRCAIREDGACIVAPAFQLQSTGARPEASVLTRGKLWLTAGARGVADVVEVCVKLADDTFVWVQIV